MIGKKYRWIPLILMLLTSTAMISVVVRAPVEGVSMYVKMPPEGYIPGVPAGDPVPVEVWIDSPVGSNIVSWSISLAWDPTVLDIGWGYWFDPDGPGPLPPMWIEFDVLEGTWLSDWTTAYPWALGTTFVKGAIDEAGGTVTLTSDSISNWAALPPATGADGNGTLAVFYFTSLSNTSDSPLDLIDADCQYGDQAGTYITDDVYDGYYNEPSKVRPDVALNGKKAWSEHHRFKRIKDGDPLINDRHGTPGYQTLYAKIKNYGTTYATVRAAFYLKGTYVAAPIYTGGETFAPGDIKTLTANCWSFLPGEEGYWDVTAEYQVYNATTSAWESGTPVKTFRFRVVP